ncbi:hypothetical protein D884_03179 [Pseudomonas sp. URMO17WK12:I10]|uniref:hypothetical protein n=1 Tax=unclassified Pseudomonas TaxID=196821 RepID=UPI000487EDB7|nr:MULTISPECIES: hypothetical protein [unclassified Pseudomonas]RDL17070.1 hypothetical protein F633_03483 [Pseudomonas sp. LAMO17WK12:I3]RED05068.1 hypothetical protein D884_03179 [Pseudomonas sp. URMO17WK12:I10]SOD08441.1 hypothetical protein SAMN05660967_01663 [Pseudomonas sp. URMO17WK12:I9]
MNHQFKPGDLALIVGANSLTQNIGKVVELSSMVKDGDLYAGPNGSLYRHSDVDCWVVRGEGVVFRTEDGVFAGFGLCEPRHLRPIGRDFTAEQQKAKEAEPCA